MAWRWRAAERTKDDQTKLDARQIRLALNKETKQREAEAKARIASLKQQRKAQSDADLASLNLEKDQLKNTVSTLMPDTSTARSFNRLLGPVPRLSYLSVLSSSSKRLKTAVPAPAPTANEASDDEGEDLALTADADWLDLVRPSSSSSSSSSSAAAPHDD